MSLTPRHAKTSTQRQKGQKTKERQGFSDRASVFSKPLSHVMNAFAADASSYRGVQNKVSTGQEVDFDQYFQVESGE